MKIEDMIEHNALLDEYPMLSARIINRWIRKKAIRYFRGRGGKIFYSLADINAAVADDMNEDLNRP